MDVHHPCFPPEAIRQLFGLEDVTQAQVSEWYSLALDSPSKLTAHERRQFKQLYDAAIVYVDRQIGRIVEHLKTTGRWDDTLVIVTSDHGELFGEYDAFGKPVRMYDELLRVPLVIVNGPDGLNQYTSDLISLLDIPPLIHEALNIEIPDEYEGQLPGHDQPRSQVIAEHQLEDQVVVGARTETQLYEYNEPREETAKYTVGPNTFDLRTESDGTFDRLQGVVDTRLESIDVTNPNTDLDADVEDRLADLGYL